MNLEPISCGSCGASLDVPKGVQFVNCRHCGSALKVQRTESASFTEVMQTLQEQSARIAGNTEVLRIQNEISLLDQEWEQQSARLMIRGKHGNTSVPGKTSSIVMGFIGTIFGIFWTSLAATNGAPLFFVGFGVIFTGMIVVMSIVNFLKAIQYQQLEAEHERKRTHLKQRLRSPGE